TNWFFKAPTTQYSWGLYISTRIPAGIVFTIEVLGFTAAIVKLAIWFYFLYVFEFRFKLDR
ncbi:hypothetical protein, partial [Flavobacterium sp. ZS1P14]|uniref:hypothetical protein n=1 Tax=Flavobacterium sp. ZS1P14 TaxID=3401729 RepID=UPI003AB0D37E